MFWGLIMEPGKKYSQLVEKSFHISQAALDPVFTQTGPVQVLLGYENRNYLLCTLIKDKVIQAPLDLNFHEGIQISFATTGPGHVHLTGYLLLDESDIESDSEEEEEEEEETNPKKRKNKMSNNKPSKKSKTLMLLDKLDEEGYNESDDSNVNLTDLLEEEEESDDASGEEEEGEDSDESCEEESDGEEDAKPPEQKTPKQNGIAKKEKTPKPEKVAKAEKTTPKGEQKQKGDKSPKGSKSPGDSSPVLPQKKTIDGGVQIEDLKVGQGTFAKPGRTVRVYYEGRLKSNNKVFDSTNKGPGFKFRLGKSEVIKGWDVGVAGMQVGGKRRIVCPPQMAYGAQGSPPVIPANSTLIFDVELKNVN